MNALPLWVAVLLFCFFATASAMSFMGGRSSAVRRFGGVAFALLGAAVLLYSFATLLFVASVD